MTAAIGAGPLAKMKVTHVSPVEYALPLGDSLVGLNEHLGKRLRLKYLGTITCTHCGRKTSKSFNQGYCYPCFRKLAQCDTCIVKPEQCHYFEGTCREPEWGETHCMREHVVYLANSSGVKVGITRAGQVPVRWIDQGAVQALPIARVDTRQQSGLLEVALKRHVADRTDWRAMLKGNIEPVDLAAAWRTLRAQAADEIAVLVERFGLQAIRLLDDAETFEFDYPVLEHPAKVRALNLDKDPLVEGTLLGIKGQYLILDTGVLNVRKYTSYHVEVASH